MQLPFTFKNDECVIIESLYFMDYKVLDVCLHYMTFIPCILRFVHAFLFPYFIKKNFGRSGFQPKVADKVIV